MYDVPTCCTKLLKYDCSWHQVLNFISTFFLFGCLARSNSLSNFILIFFLIWVFNKKIQCQICPDFFLLQVFGNESLMSESGDNIFYLRDTWHKWKRRPHFLRLKISYKSHHHQKCGRILSRLKTLPKILSPFLSQPKEMAWFLIHLLFFLSLLCVFFLVFCLLHFFCSCLFCFLICVSHSLFVFCYHLILYHFVMWVKEGMRVRWKGMWKMGF